MLAACLLLASARAADAATLYVSPTGNDSNAGTVSAPYRTIQRAANLVNPGDTVIVEDGVYTGIGTGTSCASSGRPIVCLARGGTSSAWVTFRSRNPRGAKLDGKNNDSTHGFRFLSTAAYVRIEGFEIFGIGSATAGVAGIQVYSGGHHVVIAGNEIHDVGRLCTDHVYGMSGIYVQNAAVTIEGNVLHRIGRFAPGEQGCSPKTSNYQNHDHGIYVNGKNDGSAPGAKDISITNNRFIDFTRGWPIQVYPDPVALLRIRHNTFIGANPYRTGHVLLAASTSDAQIANNVFQEPTTAGVNFSSGTHTNLRLSNNMSSTALSTTRPSGVVASGNIEYTDARLDPESGETLTDSPAIDRGIVLADVTKDIAGRPRPAGSTSDIGADEPGPGTAPTPPPPTTPEPTVDATAPVVTLTSPSNGATIGSSVSIAATASDNVAVISVKFFIDGRALTKDTSAPYTAAWGSRKAAKGPHVITAVAADAAGNSTTTSVTVNR